MYFIPFGMVLKFYKTIKDGVEWMNNKTVSKTVFNQMLPLHNILFNEYASRMKIEDTVGVFKENEIFFDGIEMKNYWEIELRYDKISAILEYNKKNLKNNTAVKNSVESESAESNSIEKIENIVNLNCMNINESNINFDLDKYDEELKEELKEDQNLSNEVEQIRAMFK